MPFNRNHVRAFLGKAEIDLFDSSLGADLKTRSAADLQRRIVRTRALRDKSRDLLRRQKLDTRARTGSKAGPGGDANERTAKKAKALEEALTRFEAQAKQLDATAKQAAGQAKKSGRMQPKASSKTAAKPAAKGAAKTGSKPSAKKAAGKDGKPATKASAKATRKTAAQPPAKKSAKAKSAGPAATRRAAKDKSVPAAVMLHELLDKKRDTLPQANGAPSKRSRKAPAVPPGGGSDGVGPTPPSVRAAVVASRLDQAGLARIQGHTGTQVRKAQAKRDHRG